MPTRWHVHLNSRIVLKLEIVIKSGNIFDNWCLIYYSMAYPDLNTCICTCMSGCMHAFCFYSPNISIPIWIMQLRFPFFFFSFLVIMNRTYWYLSVADSNEMNESDHGNKFSFWQLKSSNWTCLQINRILCHLCSLITIIKAETKLKEMGSDLFPNECNMISTITHDKKNCTRTAIILLVAVSCS